jgi:hypothetical protein
MSTILIVVLVLVLLGALVAITVITGMAIAASAGFSVIVLVLWFLGGHGVNI